MNSKQANIVRADMLVTEPHGSPLLVVETKRRRIDQAVRRQLEDAVTSVRPAFVMTVDPDQIVVAPTHNGTVDWGHSITLITAAILGQYADVPNFDRMEGFYLETLVEAWLRDLAQGWKSARPPGYQELEGIGLAARLRGSEVHAEAQL